MYTKLMMKVLMFVFSINAVILAFWLHVRKQEEKKNCDIEKLQDNTINKVDGYVIAINIVSLFLVAMLFIALTNYFPGKMTMIFAILFPAMLLTSNIKFVKLLFSEDGSHEISDAQALLLAITIISICTILLPNKNYFYPFILNPFFEITYDIATCYLFILSLTLSVLIWYRIIANNTDINRLFLFMEEFVNGSFQGTNIMNKCDGPWIWKILNRCFIFFIDVLVGCLSLVVGTIFQVLLFFKTVFSFFWDFIVNRIKIEKTQEGKTKLYTSNIILLSKWCLIVALICEYVFIMWNDIYAEKIMNLYLFISSIIVAPILISSLFNQK